MSSVLDAGKYTLRDATRYVFNYTEKAPLQAIATSASTSRTWFNPEAHGSLGATLTANDANTGLVYAGTGQPLVNLWPAYGDPDAQGKLLGVLGFVAVSDAPISFQGPRAGIALPSRVPPTYNLVLDTSLDDAKNAIKAENSIRVFNNMSEDLFDKDTIIGINGIVMALARQTLIRNGVDKITNGRVVNNTLYVTYGVIGAMSMEEKEDGVNIIKKFEGPELDTVLAGLNVNGLSMSAATVLALNGAAVSSIVTGVCNTSGLIRSGSMSIGNSKFQQVSDVIARANGLGVQPAQVLGLHYKVKIAFAYGRSLTAVVPLTQVLETLKAMEKSPYIVNFSAPDLNLQLAYSQVTKPTIMFMMDYAAAISSIHKGMYSMGVSMSEVLQSAQYTEDTVNGLLGFAFDNLQDAIRDAQFNDYNTQGMAWAERFVKALKQMKQGAKVKSIIEVLGQLGNEPAGFFGNPVNLESYKKKVHSLVNSIYGGTASGAQIMGVTRPVNGYYKSASTGKSGPSEPMALTTPAFADLFNTRTRAVRHGAANLSRTQRAEADLARAQAVVAGLKRGRAEDEAVTAEESEDLLPETKPASSGGTAMSVFNSAKVSASGSADSMDNISLDDIGTDPTPGEGMIRSTDAPAPTRDSPVGTPVSTPRNNSQPVVQIQRAPRVDSASAVETFISANPTFANVWTSEPLDAYNANNPLYSMDRPGAADNQALNLSTRVNEKSKNGKIETIEYAVAAKLGTIMLNKGEAPVGVMAALPIRPELRCPPTTKPPTPGLTGSIQLGTGAEVFPTINADSVTEVALTHLPLTTLTYMLAGVGGNTKVLLCLREDSPLLDKMWADFVVAGFGGLAVGPLVTVFSSYAGRAGVYYYASDIEIPADGYTPADALRDLLKYKQATTGSKRARSPDQVESVKPQVRTEVYRNPKSNHQFAAYQQDYVDEGADPFADFDVNAGGGHPSRAARKWSEGYQAAMAEMQSRSHSGGRGRGGGGRGGGQPRHEASASGMGRVAASNGNNHHNNNNKTQHASAAGMGRAVAAGVPPVAKMAPLGKNGAGQQHLPPHTYTPI